MTRSTLPQSDSPVVRRGDTQNDLIDTSGICLVICTYNNVRTIAAVLRGALEFIPDILVVNDGSTDGTGEVLEETVGIHVITHEVNEGKGAALRHAFDRARELGFTHAITMDADGQHSPEEIPRFVETIRVQPSAIVLGNRSVGGGGRSRKSRVLRRNSNFWTWTATGTWVSDSQTGFRAYPLASLSDLRFLTCRYDFEIEVLVLALWNDLPVVSVPVAASYGPGSESHFRPFVDFMRVSRLFVRLLAQRVFLPKSIRRRVYMRAFAEGPWAERVGRNLRAYLLQESTTPGRFAACIGVGVCCGILPIWGFQAATGLVLAQWLRLSRTLTVLATNVSLPVFMPPILYMSILIGHRLLMGEFDPTLNLDELEPQHIGRYAATYLLGSTVFAFIAGAVAAAAAFAVSCVAVRLYRET